MWQPPAQRDGANNNLRWPQRLWCGLIPSRLSGFSNVPKWNPSNYRCERSRTRHQNYFGSLTQFVWRRQLEWRKWEASQACGGETAGSGTKTHREIQREKSGETDNSSPSGDSSRWNGGWAGIRPTATTSHEGRTTFRRRCKKNESPDVSFNRFARGEKRRSCNYDTFAAAWFNIFNLYTPITSCLVAFLSSFSIVPLQNTDIT